MFNTLDFGIFFDSTINKVYIEVSPSIQLLHPTSITVNRAAAFTSADFARAAAASTKPKVHHVNVICDQCDKDIYGFRYKCMECWDYDLCMDCEAKMTHKEHIMLRIPDPKDADFVSRIE